MKCKRKKSKIASGNYKNNKFHSVQISFDILGGPMLFQPTLHIMNNDIDWKVTFKSNTN